MVLNSSSKRRSTSCLRLRALKEEEEEEELATRWVIGEWNCPLRAYTIEAGGKGVRHVDTGEQIKLVSLTSKTKGFIVSTLFNEKER